MVNSGCCININNGILQSRSPQGRPLAVLYAVPQDRALPGLSAIENPKRGFPTADSCTARAALPRAAHIGSRKSPFAGILNSEDGAVRARATLPT